MRDEERDQAAPAIEEPEDPELRKIRLETEVMRLQTRAIEAGRRRDRVRRVLGVAKWTVIAAAVFIAFKAADRLGSL